MKASLTHVHVVQPHAPTPTPTRTDLSIADTATACFGSATALWVFDQHPSLKHLSISFLIKSLSQTLSSFSHFAGQIGSHSYPSQGNESLPHGQRFRRCFILHGYPSDPGVELQFATLEINAADVFPDENARTTSALTWDLSEFPIETIFSPEGDMPILIGPAKLGVSAVKIRVTYLTCGAMVIVSKISHPLADAITLVTFMKRWGNVYSTLSRPAPLSDFSPVFDPTMLDSMASGNLDGPAADPKLIEKALALPLPRYDWWAHEKGNPEMMDNNDQVVVPDEIPKEVAEARLRGRQLPWQEWNFDLTVQHKIYRITADEVDRIYNMAVKYRKDSSSTTSVSQHDVVTSFVWQLIALSKGSRAEEEISLDMTLGLRSRLDLPAEYIGSPILLAGLSTPYRTVIGDQNIFPDFKAVYDTALVIRNHVRSFDKAAIGTWLHEQAFDIAPQRWWNGFLGSRHTFVTSWVRAGVWDVDFDLQSRQGSIPHQRPSSGPKWAGVIGPNLDGLTVITEAKGGQTGKWWHCGVDVDVKVEVNAMDRIESKIAQWRADKEGCSMISLQ